MLLRPLRRPTRVGEGESLDPRNHTDEERRMDLSPGYLITSFGVSIVGFALFLYGKKQIRIPQLVAGTAMMVYPYFVTSPLWMLTVAGGLSGGLWIATRNGL